MPTDEPIGAPHGRTTAGEAIPPQAKPLVLLRQLLDSKNVRHLPIHEAMDHGQACAIDIRPWVRWISLDDIEEQKQGALRVYYRCSASGHLGVKVQHGIPSRLVFVPDENKLQLQGVCQTVAAGNAREWSLQQCPRVQRMVQAKNLPQFGGLVVWVLHDIPAREYRDFGLQTRVVVNGACPAVLFRRLGP